MDSPEVTYNLQFKDVLITQNAWLNRYEYVNSLEDLLYKIVVDLPTLLNEVNDTTTFRLVRVTTEVI